MAQAQASNPLPAALGAEGVPITLLFESMSCICSEVVSLTAAPLIVPELNAGLVRLGSAAKPASVPISSGVSSIHSALACVEGYGTVVVNVSFLVTSGW